MASESSIPALWEPWLRALEVRPPPREPRSNCAACVMCSDDDWTSRHAEVRFRPDARCCTYLPGLWCFQVGGALADEATPPAVRARLLERVNSPLAGPVGVAPTTPDDTRYQLVRDANQFGRTAALVCPYFVADDGSCGVWRYRNAVCATWHCRYERGMSGLGYWTAIRCLLESLEFALANRAAAALLDSSDVLDWSAWTGTRESFYRLTHQWVRGLNAAAILEDLPVDVWDAARVAIVARSQLESRALPTTAELREAAVAEQLEGAVRVVGYSWYDTAVIPIRLFKRLEAFDGRPLDEVRAELASQESDPTDAVLRRLLDIDVLR